MDVVDNKGPQEQQGGQQASEAGPDPMREAAIGKPKRRKVGPRCGRKTRQGHPCTRKAGERTDHPGDGPCWLHGGKSPIKHGLYAKYLHGRTLRKLVGEFQQSREEVLDLVPDISLIRALTIDYLNRHTTKAGNLKADLDVDTASKLLDRCGRLVERIHSAQRAGQVSMGAVMKLQEGMALVVLQELQRGLPTREAADDVAKRIADRWDGLVVEGT